MNEFDHMNFDPVIKSQDGRVYFDDVYSTPYQTSQYKEGGEEAKQQYFYCSVNAKDIDKKD